MGNVKSLPDHIAAMPVKEVNRSTKNMLAQKLDPPSVGYNENMVSQDWSGLAELMLLDPEEIDVYEKAIDAKEAKTLGILKKWSFQPGSNVGKLCQLIEELERHDILDDERILKRLMHDYEAYKSRRQQQEKEDELYQENLREHLHPVQVPEITSDHQDLIEQKDRDYDEMKHIVVDDVMHPHKPQVVYDAFVSYVRQDMEFVQEMIEMVENQHGLRLCVNARDLLPGVSTHFVTAKLIADRCRKVILVMSPDFLSSSECEFQVKIALSLSPGARQKILIPVVYRPCKIPLVLQHICTVDFTKMDIADWFWMRLAASLREAHVSATRQLTFDESISLQKVELELLPDTDTESGAYKGKDMDLKKPIAPVIKPRFRTQQHQPAFDQQLYQRNENQNNNDLMKENPVKATNPNVNKEVNQLDKDSDHVLKKKKEKRGFLQRFERKDKNKSKESSDGSKDGNEDSMECRENTFGYISGENNEELGSPPPRDIPPAVYPQKVEKSSPKGSGEVTPVKLQGRGLPNTASPHVRPQNHVPPPSKSNMINHPMFTNFKKKLHNLTPKSRRNQKPGSAKEQASLSTDASSSVFSSETGSDSTLKSYTESDLTSLSKSVREAPIHNKINGATPAGVAVHNRYHHHAGNAVANVVNPNGYPDNIRNGDSGSMHLPSSSVGTSAGGRRRAETSMEGMDGSMKTSLGQSARGVCLPPPRIARPNHDDDRCTTTTTTNTDYSRNTSQSSSQTPNEEGLYSLESNDIQLPGMSTSSNYENHTRQTVDQSNHVFINAGQSQNGNNSPMDQSYSRYDDSFHHDKQNLASLAMSHFEFNFNGQSSGNNVTGLSESANSAVELPPPFLPNDLMLNYEADDDSMSIEPEISGTASTIRDLFPSTASRNSDANQKASPQPVKIATV